MRLRRPPGHLILSGLKGPEEKPATKRRFLGRNREFLAVQPAPSRLIRGHKGEEATPETFFVAPSILSPHVGDFKPFGQEITQSGKHTHSYPYSISKIFHTKIVYGLLYR